MGAYCYGCYVASLEATLKEQKQELEKRDAEIKKLKSLIEDLEGGLKTSVICKVINLEAALEKRDARISELEAANKNLQELCDRLGKEVIEWQDRYKKEISKGKR
jgi:chromosome segregation ATPase